MRVTASELAEVARSTGSGDILLTHHFAVVTGRTCQAVGVVGGAKKRVEGGVGASNHLCVGGSGRTVVALVADATHAAERTSSTEGVLGAGRAVVTRVARTSGGVVTLASAVLTGEAENTLAEVAASELIVVRTFGAVGDGQRGVGGAVATERAVSAVDAGSTAEFSFGAGDAFPETLIRCASTRRASDGENRTTSCCLRAVETLRTNTAEEVRRVEVVGAVGLAGHVAASCIGTSTRAEETGRALQS